MKTDEETDNEMFKDKLGVIVYRNQLAYRFKDGSIRALIFTGIKQNQYDPKRKREDEG